MKHKHSLESMDELYQAIKANDLSKVKELIKNNKAHIDNIACMQAVQLKRLEILEFFLQSCDNVPNVLLYALDESVIYHDLESLKLIVRYFKERKSQYTNCNMDSVIYSAIKEAVKLEQRKQLFSSEASQIVKCICSIYYR